MISADIRHSGFELEQEASDPCDDLQSDGGMVNLVNRSNRWDDNDKVSITRRLPVYNFTVSTTVHNRAIVDTKLCPWCATHDQYLKSGLKLWRYVKAGNSRVAVEQLSRAEVKRYRTRFRSLPVIATARR